MTLKHAWPLLVLLASACAGAPKPLQPVPAVAERRQCPGFPLPPEALLRQPVKTDFLTPID